MSNSDKYAGLSDKGIQHPPLPADRKTVFKTTLDPITFEVLRNAFVNIVDQMAEQLLRTCYSFVIYCRDFSSGLSDPQGNLVMQGTGDIAAHVGTLHYQLLTSVDFLECCLNALSHTFWQPRIQQNASDPSERHF